MAIDYDRLMNLAPMVLEQSYTARDSVIYALAVGCGVDVDDPWLRQHLSPLPPARTLPGLVSVLAAPRLVSLGLGLTYEGILHGSQGFVTHELLPAEGHLRSESRVVGIFDRGEGKGSRLDMVRELRDAETGVHYATLEQSFICRLDQAPGAPPVEKTPPSEVGIAAPDLVISFSTARESAQIFSLTGDQNPLHLVPEVAVKAGFPQPILHGMATYGHCAVFVEKALCDADGKWAGHRLGAISGKFISPVFLGETIEVDIWYEENGARIEARVPARDKLVFAGARVAIEKVV